MATHLHILGICGTFMGGIAAIAKAAGYRVTGCDANVYPPMSDQLRGARHRAHRGLRRRPARAAPGPLGGRQRRDARQPADGGDPRPRASATFPARSGSRSTCSPASMCSLSRAPTARPRLSAMLAWILERAGRAPGFLIGGVPHDFPVSARLTRSPFFVIEADEYDTAFFDKRSKFVHYRPPHRNSEQPRVRSCRHLRRSCGDRAAIPPLRADCAAVRADRRQWRRRER